jgi:hypothetical protein
MWWKTSNSMGGVHNQESFQKLLSPSNLAFSGMDFLFDLWSLVSLLLGRKRAFQIMAAKFIIDFFSVMSMIFAPPPWLNLHTTTEWATVIFSLVFSWSIQALFLFYVWRLSKNGTLKQSRCFINQKYQSMEHQTEQVFVKGNVVIAFGDNPVGNDSSRKRAIEGYLHCSIWSVDDSPQAADLDFSVAAVKDLQIGRFVAGQTDRSRLEGIRAGVAIQDKQTDRA